MSQTEKIKIKLDVNVNNKDLQKVDKSLNNIKDDAGKASNEVKDIGSSAKKSIPGMKSLENSADNLSNTLKGAAGFLAGAFAVNSVVEYGNKLDDMEARITTISRGQTDLFEEFKNFDGRFLYDVDDAMETMNKLRNLGVEVNRDVLTTISDIASSTGEQIGTVADQFAAALRGEEGSLDDYFKKIKTVNGQLFGEYVNDQKQVVTVSLNNMAEIQGAFDAQYAGATAKRLATTAGQYEVLKQKIMTSFANLYKEAQPTINELMDDILSVSTEIGEFLSKNKNTILDGYYYIKATVDKIVAKILLGALVMRGAWISLTDNIGIIFDKVSTKIKIAFEKIILKFKQGVASTLELASKIPGVSDLVGDKLLSTYEDIYKSKNKIAKLESNLSKIQLKDSEEFLENTRLIESAQKNANKTYDDYLVQYRMANMERKNAAIKEFEISEAQKESIKNQNISALNIEEQIKQDEIRIENEKEIENIKKEQLKIDNDLANAAKKKAEEAAKFQANEAKKKAEAIANEAKKKAEAIANEAKKKAEAIANEAKRKAEAIISGIEAEKNRQNFGVSVSNSDITKTSGISAGLGQGKNDFIMNQLGIEDPNQTELEKMEEHNAQRLELAKKYGADKKLQDEIEAQGERDILDRKQEMYNEGLGAMSNAFDAMYQASGESSKELFYLSKTFAIAQAGVAMFQGAAEAMKLGWPAGIGAAAGVMAQGASIIANLNSIADPKFHDGGFISGGGGDNLRGDEKRAILQTGEGVLSRKGMDALDKLNRGENSNNSGVPEVYMFDNREQATEAYLKSRSGKKLIKEIGNQK